MKLRWILCFLPLLFLLAFSSKETVKINLPEEKLDDAVMRGLLNGENIPLDIFSIQQKLENWGGVITPYIVANRGYHNPEGGSFSVFESYQGPIEDGVVKEGEFFLGFFTFRDRQTGILSTWQNPSRGLMVEIIAWDYTKKMFNFWELVGTSTGPEWFYRGDSEDVLLDIQKINTGDGNNSFGQRLRCSGCHTLGGPILKEMNAPHNDWWTNKYGLELGTLTLLPGDNPFNPDHFMSKMFQNAQDVSFLQQKVQTGIQFYVNKSNVWKKFNHKSQLRSLFFTMEMNLVSDVNPLESSDNHIQIPISFFVDSRLLTESTNPIQVNKEEYKKLLHKIQSKFAPKETTNQQDSRHPFLVPERSYIDNQVIDRLIQEGIIDEEFVADVLAIDFTTPIYSKKRAALFTHVPEEFDNAQDLREKMISSLAMDSSSLAQELHKNLTDPARDLVFHQQNALRFVEQCRNLQNDPKAIHSWMILASQRRLEVKTDITSQNPRGEILEPGFRVVFPENNLSVKPNQWQLNSETGLLELTEK